MNENNIIDYSETDIEITYHADKSHKYLLRCFFLFIINLVLLVLLGQASQKFRNPEILDETTYYSVMRAFIWLIRILYLILNIFGILGLYHLVISFRKSEKTRRSRRYWLIFLGGLNFLIVALCIFLLFSPIN